MAGFWDKLLTGLRWLLGTNTPDGRPMDIFDPLGLGHGLDEEDDLTERR